MERRVVNRVIDIRGPNGAGKTYAVRGLMRAAWNVVPLRGPGLDPEHFGRAEDVWATRLEIADVDRPIYVVGPYDDAPTGGCDRIRTQDDVTRRIELLAREGHVVFEGAITGTIFGRYAALAERLRAEGTAEWIVYTLDTPLDVCLDRVRARREGRGADRDAFKPELVVAKRRAIDSAAAKFRDAGVRVAEGPAEWTALVALLAPEQGALSL